MSKTKVPLIAIILLVLLRIAIGWQFLYEGLWKYDTLDTPTPWSAEGYLKAAQGPFRQQYLAMTGDPYDYGWLEFETVSRNWYDWRTRFILHYNLDVDQQKALSRLLDGVDTANDDASAVPARSFARPLAILPNGVDLNSRSLNGTFTFANGQLTASQPVLPSEESALVAMVPDDAAFKKVVEALAKDSRTLSFRQRLAAILRGDPDRVGVIGRLNEKGTGYEPVMGTVTAAEETAAQTNIRYGQIQEYKDLVTEYEEGLKTAKVDYQSDHLAMINKKAQILKAQLVPPVKSLETELKEKALELVTGEQMELGSVPPADTPLQQASMRAMWGLLILGALLLLGFCTRLAAVAGAVMLTTFYLVLPPWPGVPQPPGPEHSLFINKTSIEVFALLALAALPTGSWFGIDGIISRMFLKDDDYGDE